MNDQILVAHLLGPAAEEVTNLFAMAMKSDLTATDLKSRVFADPTFGADVRLFNAEARNIIELRRDHADLFFAR